MLESQTFPPQIFYRDDFLISTDPRKIDVDMVHHYLAYESYWAPGIARQSVKRALRYSLCFGVYDCSGTDEIQIGFARVITDFSSFAYLADVFILSRHRCQGLGKWLISCILAHTELQGLRKWMLNTKDAHGLYERFGFLQNPEPDTYMAYRPQHQVVTLTE
jgi:GNAT superfamily N-acetyltransferase